MLIAASALKDYSIEAQDGALGAVQDLLFDDRTWRIRWLVVETGGWPKERKILLHPSAIGQVNIARETLQLALTKLQVQESPSLRSDLPVSQQHEAAVYSYHDWSPFWGDDPAVMINEIYEKRLHSHYGWKGYGW